MRKVPRVAAVAASIAVAVATASPAGAADTTTTLAVAAGTLTISAPATKAMGTGAAGSAISASLGAVTVDDSRGALQGSWTALVSSSDFSNTTTPAAQVIPKANVSYAPGTVTTTGTSVVTPGLSGSLAAGRTACGAASTVGNNTATWSPTVTVNLPAGAIAGSYSGTITHSVS